MDNIHLRFLQHILDVDNNLIQPYRPHLQHLEQTYGEHSLKANIMGQIMGSNKDHLLNLSATNETYFVDAWWQKNNMHNIPQDVKEKFITEQIMHLRFYFFLKMVSTVEFQCRKLIRELYPPNEGRADFFNVYTDLLTNLGLHAQYCETFNVARLVRNTLHNLGMHTSASQTVTFLNNQYQFVQWQQIDFFTSAFSIDVQRLLIAGIVDITLTERFQEAEF